MMADSDLVRTIFDHAPTIVTFITVGAGAVWAIKRDVAVVSANMTSISERTGEIESEMKKITEIMIAQARDNERLNNQGQQIVSQGAQIVQLATSFEALRGEFRRIKGE